MATKSTESVSRQTDVGRGQEASLSPSLALGDVGGVGLQSVSLGKQKILSKREPAEQSANDGGRSAHLAGNVSWAPLPRPKITPRFLFSTPHRTPPSPEILISWLLAQKTYWWKKKDSPHTSTGAEAYVRAGVALYLAVVVAVSLRRHTIIRKKTLKKKLRSSSAKKQAEGLSTSSAAVSDDTSEIRAH